MTSGARRVSVLAAATVAAVFVAGAAVEAWVRLSWDPKRGSPTFFLSDPVLGQRLASGYNGWFAGVPVRINNLGFRADRDYDRAKQPDAYRILVLGDSVTFGHGSVYEHTYPVLLEQRLRSWRPAVQWQVWNAGVPGYNTGQELGLLQRIGPAVKPDLVVVGFFPNDVSGNDIVAAPGAKRAAATTISNFVRRTFYSAEFYRRAYLQLTWRWFASDAAERLLRNLSDEEALLADPGKVADLEQQQITHVDVISDEDQKKAQCVARPDAPEEIRQLQHDSTFASWQRAVHGFQELNRAGTYRIVFFLNTAPEPCPDNDLFFDGGSRLWNDFFASQIGDGVPVISTYDAFLHRRPSQMPGAKGHSLGNANVVKADVLFDYVKEHGA